MISCILLGAGAGRRMGLDENKIFLKLGVHSVLQWTILHLLEFKEIGELIIVYAADEEDRVKGEIEVLSLNIPIVYVKGGVERQDSVKAGLSKVSENAEIVLVHDGARPLARRLLIQRVVEGAKHYGAAVPGISVVDTIKEISDSNEVVRTLDRNSLRAVQTPQGFQKDILVEAHDLAAKEGYQGTDDVSLVEYLGKPVTVVEGDVYNIKITTPNDRLIAIRYLGVENSMMRVGYGYDVHRFKEGRPCILGGVVIPSPIGPDGHSDADVLVHALMDALLGAAGLRDIGYYFPPEDNTYKGISSMILLEQVCNLLEEHHFVPYNIDIMVIAEAPKLKPYIEKMKENLSKALRIPKSRVSVKATTNEGLGAFGRQEGIAAQAVVTIYERED